MAISSQPCGTSGGLAIVPAFTHTGHSPLAATRRAHRLASGREYSSAAVSARGNPGAAMHTPGGMCLRQQCDVGAVAARVVQRRQPQRHHQQPASTTPPAGSTRLFHSAARCRPVRQRTSHSQAIVADDRERPTRSHAKCGLEAGREPRHVGRRLGRHAGLHRDVDDPHPDRQQREEEHREPVDGRSWCCGSTWAARMRPAPRARAGRASARGRSRPSRRRPPTRSAAPTGESPHGGATGTGASATASTTPAARPATGTTATAGASCTSCRGVAGGVTRQAHWPSSQAATQATHRGRGDPPAEAAHAVVGGAGADYGCRRRRAPPPSWVRRCRPESAARTRCRCALAARGRAPRREPIGQPPPQPTGPTRAWSRGRVATARAWRPTRARRRRRSRARSRRGLRLAAKGEWQRLCRLGARQREAGVPESRPGSAPTAARTGCARPAAGRATATSAMMNAAPSQ